MRDTARRAVPPKHRGEGARVSYTRAMNLTEINYQPGMRVRVTQQIPFGKQTTTISVEGEIVVVNLDQYSRVEML